MPNASPKNALFKSLLGFLINTTKPSVAFNKLVTMIDIIPEIVNIGLLSNYTIRLALKTV